MKLVFDQKAVDVWSGPRGLRKFVNMAAIARELGIRQISVSAWKHVPKKRVEAVSDALLIPPHVLRPDLYAQAQTDESHGIPADPNQMLLFDSHA